MYLICVARQIKTLIFRFVHKVSKCKQYMGKYGHLHIQQEEYIDTVASSF